MGTEDKVILELLESHTTLTSDNPTLELGQRVFVTGITDALGNGEKIGDGATAYTSLKWQRCETLKTIDLTSANTTYTLPKILGGYQRVSIYADNGGTYKMTLAVSNSELVDGIVAGTWEIEGKGRIIVESDGTNWQVREYEDSGSNTYGEWYKYANGTMLATSVETASIITNTASGSIFSAPGTTTLTLPKTFITGFKVSPQSTPTAGRFWCELGFENTLSTVLLRPLGSTNISAGTISVTCNGRWRT